MPRLIACLERMDDAVRAAADGKGGGGARFLVRMLATTLSSLATQDVRVGHASLASFFRSIAACFDAKGMGCVLSRNYDVDADAKRVWDAVLGAAADGAGRARALSLSDAEAQLA